MKNTVVILEAGIGAMSYAFEKAGFQIAAAYEEDKKAVELYRRNLTHPITECRLSDIDPYDVPDMDILAGQLFFPAFRVAGRSEKQYDSLKKWREIVFFKKPSIFLLVTNSVMSKNPHFLQLIEDMTQEHYSISYQAYEVIRHTGIPVNEKCYCIIGISDRLPKEYKFISDTGNSPLSVEDFCSGQKEIDPWYFQISREQIRAGGIKNSFLCWNGDHYTEKELLVWNAVKIPLVRIGNTVRKLTHEEVAHLKGFPHLFSFQDPNRAWLYKKLIYSPNVLLLKQIARSLMYLTDERSVRDSQAVNAIHFEKIFAEYLTKKSGKDYMKESGLKYYPPSDDMLPTDFVCTYYDRKVFIELKFYNYNLDINLKVMRACHTLRKQLPQEETIVLVIGNIVSETVKEECEKRFGIFIWDVKNILWLFEEYPDIKNDFVALLNYSVSGIPLQKPNFLAIPKPQPDTGTEKQPPSHEQDTEEGMGEQPQKDIGKELKKELMQIRPGKEDAGKYEHICTEILKHVLGDYLSLWKTQEKSNADLYRFDLYCKINPDADHDFFHMLTDFYKTKYLIFEFKNYTGKITQKEIYTTEKYLYEKALRQVAILISRNGPDANAVTALKGSLRENGKLILCLSDEDLINLIDIKEKNERPTAEYFGDLLDDLLLHLEK